MYALRDWFSHTCAKRNHAFERGLIYGVLGNIKWFSALHHILLFAAGCASAAKQHSTRHVYVCTSCPLPCTFRPLLPASYSYLSCLLHLDPSQALGLMERTAPSGTMSGSTKKNAALSSESTSDCYSVTHGNSSVFFFFRKRSRAAPCLYWRESTRGSTGRMGKVRDCNSVRNTSSRRAQCLSCLPRDTTANAGTPGD
jgi:hypothetical protein